ncbi:MAG TPA: O-antigen ligase family protein [Candidatus Angelobacter sp.]|nr:O-antigen ligase family protein [Candidatus Angelobacter sp.]
MRFLRLGICALVVFAVAAHGGVEDWARAILEIGAGLLFFIWALRFYFNEKPPLAFSPLLPPLAGFFLVALGQWFFHTTASPFHTRVELMLLLADLLLLFLAVQAFRSLEDWRGFVWFAMGFGFLVAVFGILQHLTFNGKLYWFRELRYGGIPFGPYANRNHFAGLMELLLPLSLVPLVLGRVRRERWAVVGLFAILPVAAILLSASRGGIVSFAAQLALLALVMMRSGAIRGKHLLAGGAVLLLALTIVTWLGVDRILQRFSSLQLLEVSEGKRASMRRDTWHIFLDHPMVGTGLGTLQVVYPQYETGYDGKIVNHTHNDYLEALAETGVLGGLCCAWFLAALASHSLWRLRRFPDSFAGALQLSAMVACAGILVHALVDFNFHIPSNLLLFFLMAHLATAEIQQVPSPATSRHHHRNSRNS